MNIEEQESELMDSVHLGNLRKVKHIVKTGYKLTKVKRQSVHSVTYDSGRVDTSVPTPTAVAAMNIASRLNHRSIVKYLIKMGVPVDGSSNYAIRWASRNGHLSMVRLLHKHGANNRDCSDIAVRWAIEHEHLDLVKYLIKKGSVVMREDNLSLEIALSNTGLSVIKYLVDKYSCAKILHTIMNRKRNVSYTTAMVRYVGGLPYGHKSIR